VTAAAYACVLRELLPGWTVEPDRERGVLRITSPLGAVGLFKPGTGRWGRDEGIRFWTHPNPEYCGTRGARRLAAMLMEKNA